MNVLRTNINDQYMVSTIFRKCSALGCSDGEMAYYETCVFRIGEARRLGELLVSFSANTHTTAIERHTTLASTYALTTPFDEEAAKEHWRSLERMYEDGA